MKKIISFVIALGFSVTTMANIVNDSATKTRVYTTNGIETVVIQKTFASENINSKVDATNKMLENAFGKEAKINENNNKCTFDYISENGDSAKLIVDKLNNKILLITRKKV